MEGARGIAALSVVFFHVGWETPGGPRVYLAITGRMWLGVPLFFLLSGFLLYRPFARATIHQRPWPSLARYGRARFLRIFPAYWVVLTLTILETGAYILPYGNGPHLDLVPVALAACAAVAWVITWRRRSSPPLAVVLSAGALVLLALNPHSLRWGTSNYLLVFMLLNHPAVIRPAWTLCLEVAFYAVLPILAVLANRVARRGTSIRRRAALLALAFAPIGPIAYAYAARAETDHSWPIWLPAYLDEFAIGMYLAIAAEVWPRVRPWTSRTLLVGGLAVCMAAERLYHVGPQSAVGNYSGMAYGRTMEVGFALLLASVVLREERTMLGSVLSWRPLAALGTISYGIYLWHMPVIERLSATPLWWSQPWDVVLPLTITIALASASWLLLERHAIALKDRPLGAYLRNRRETSGDSPRPPWPESEPGFAAAAGD